MRMAIVALGAAVALCNVGTFGAAQAQNGNGVREPQKRRVIRVPIVRETPYWDSYIVPRYRYRPEDDRVDPCGGPVVPIINYGPQEIPIPPELAARLGLGRIHGRDWPCGRRYR